MSIAKITEEQFIKEFPWLGSSGLSKKYGGGIRAWQKRRRRIERFHNITLNPPQIQGEKNNVTFNINATSTLYDAKGNVKLEWVKSGVDKEEKQIEMEKQKKKKKK